MHPWIQQNQDVRVGFAERCDAIAGHIREAVLFAGLSGLISFSADARMKPTQIRLKTPGWPTESESAVCLRRARFVGRWLANAGGRDGVRNVGDSSMIMQVRSIILYNSAGAMRELAFTRGAVNIITGRSLTGKSAIVEIIDYHLGRSTFLIPEGVIRDTVAWYAVVFSFGDGTEVLIAKPTPRENATSQSQAYYEVGRPVVAPPLDKLIANTNDDSVVSELSKRLGIVPNLHKPALGQTRDEVEATVRHTVYYLFQTQGLIASKELLFHRQLEPFIAQAIKDTLPYFLGVANSDRVRLEH